MFKIKNRLCSESRIEQICGLFYIVCLLSIPTVIYVSITYYLAMNIYCLIGLGLYTLFILTTLSGMVDFGNLKNSHNNSYEKYKATLNPSKGSYLYNSTQKHIELKEDKPYSTDMSMAGFSLFMAITIAVISGIFWMVSHDSGPFVLALLNIVLMYASYYFGGVLINTIEVSPEQIEEISNISDLSFLEKSKCKTYLKEKVKKNKRITRANMRYVFKVLDIMKKARDLNEALES